MNRILGKSKPKGPAPTLGDSADLLEKRGDHLDVKIAKCDEQLLKYKEQMKRLRPGPQQNQIKQKALQVLKQKKMYENQRGAVSNQQFNVEQLAFTADSAKGTVEQVNAMKGAALTLKKEMKQIKIEQVEDLQDDLMDIYSDMEEIQDVMGRAYGCPDDIDEDDLENELACLDDGDMLGDYLDATDTSHVNLPAQTNPAQPDTTVSETDPNVLEQQLGL